MKTSLRALLLDFDGVLADTEPVHFRMFQQVLREEGVDLSKKDYYEKYLGLDDRSCFETVYKDQGRSLSGNKKSELIRKKNRALLQDVKGHSLFLPGVPEFLEKVSEKYFLAVVSGALKSEIQAILTAGQLLNRFHLIVGADDVSQGKPHPEGFLTAIKLLNRDFVPPSEILLPDECLAIEDSPWGIEAAKSAGTKCLAVLTSYPEERLTKADLIIPNLTQVPWARVEALF